MTLSQIGGSTPQSVFISDPSVTGYGEVIVAGLSAVCQIDFVYNVNANVATTSLTGSGTATTANALLSLSTTAATSSSASLASRRYLKNRDGQSGLCRVSALFSAGVSGSVQIVGMGDGYNAFGFGFNGGTFGILYRTSTSGSAVDTWIPQTSWNVDVLSGTSLVNNPSGILLSPLAGNVYQIRAADLGFGETKFYIINPKTGLFTLVHNLTFPNSAVLPVVTNPSMGAYLYAANTTNNTNIILKSTSAALFVEGDIAQIGNTYGKNSTKTGITTETSIISLQNQLTFGGVPNKSLVYIKSISICSVGGTGYSTLNLVLNSVLGGSPSYNAIDANNSVVFFDVAGTTRTGGIIQFNATINNVSNLTFDLSQYEIFMAPGDTLTAFMNGSTSTSCTVSINWQEDI